MYLGPWQQLVFETHTISFPVAGVETSLTQVADTTSQEHLHPGLTPVADGKSTHSSPQASVA